MNESEKAVVSVAINYPKYHSELFELISTHEFFENPTCRQIIKACYKLREEGFTPDLINIHEETKIPAKELASLSRVEVTDFMKAALNVRENWMRREAKYVIQEALQSDEDDVFQFINEIAAKLEKILSSVDGLRVRKLSDITQEATEQIKVISENSSSLTGADTGIDKLNRFTRGFQKTDLIICAARPGMGKTALALNAARQSSRQGKVLFFSLEMSAVQLVKRLVTQFEDITMTEVFSEGVHGERWEAYGIAVDRVNEMNLEIHDQLNHIEDIANKSAVLCRKHKVSLIVIDYLQICATRERTQGEENRISTMSWKAKQIAKRNNVPVLLLSQLSRQVENRPNKQPQLSDLRYSGAIEQDADMVIFPWNSEEYDMVDEQGQYYAQIEIAKYRNGKTAMITDLEMVGQHQLWKEKESGFISGGDVKF